MWVIDWGEEVEALGRNSLGSKGGPDSRGSQAKVWFQLKSLLSLTPWNSGVNGTSELRQEDLASVLQYQAASGGGGKWKM